MHVYITVILTNATNCHVYMELDSGKLESLHDYNLGKNTVETKI